MLDVKHVARRRKEARAFVPRERPSIVKMALDILIYPVAIVAPFALLPQVIKLYSTQDATSLSLLTWCLFVTFNLVWLLYGRVHKEWPIIITNTSLFLLNSSVIVGILLYR